MSPSLIPFSHFAVVKASLLKKLNMLFAKLSSMPFFYGLRNSSDCKPTCVVLKKNGEACGCKARYYNPILDCYECRRHLRLSNPELARMESYVLCDYGKNGLALSLALDQKGELVIDADPIGDAACEHILDGHIRIRIGMPITYEDVCITFRSQSYGLGDHFNRSTLAYCIANAVSHILHNPHTFPLATCATLSDIRLINVSYDTSDMNSFVLNLMISSNHATP